MPVFKHLFTPIRINSMTAKNRILMPAMSINFGVDDNGHVNDQLTGYFKARAAGGAGLLLVGGGGVHPTGLELPRLPWLWDDDCIPSLSRMVAQVKAHDVCFGMQLMHGGRQSYHDDKVAPSPIPAPAVVKGTPRELTIPEIKELVTAFGDAARRCKDAGFDFIEIHGAHGYLINQFLAPNANQRKDAYGGAFENRIRFLIELMEDIKAKTGSDFPVGVRINGMDYIQGGWQMAEALRLVPILEQAGADYLHVSAGVYGSTQLTIPSMYVEQGCFVELAAEIKKIVTVPVVAVGRIKDPEMAESILQTGQADLIAMGRSLIADPQMPDKVREGRSNEVRPCIGCCLGCIHAVLHLEPGACVVNPNVGREYQLAASQRAAKPQSVLILGGGPAGLAAARSAARKGHRVVLCDDQAELGGLIRLAAKAPGRGELMDVITYFKRELNRLGVEIRLNVNLDEELIHTVNPDVVILASGSLPEAPVISGLSQTQMAVYSVVDVLEGGAATGSRVLVLGGGQSGLVLADFLAEKGKQVVVLNRKRHFAEEMSANDRFYLRERLKRHQIALHKLAQVQKITQDGVVFKQGDETLTLEGFDALVIAENHTSIREAKPFLESHAAKVLVIGDAKLPRNLMLAISEGEEAVDGFSNHASPKP